MAYSLNRAQVIGNVTRDPEVRQTSSGQMVASFGIATNSTWIDKAGQKQEKAEFHNIVLWGKLAEIAQAYLKKGRKIFVEGRMQTREWEGEDSHKRSKMEIVAEQLILLDRSGAPTGEGVDATYERSSNSSAIKSQTPSTSETPEEAAVTLDDLPF
ncbi:single-stranded DNA-binding protein [Candidatus Peregrinibacteria bacterium]|nr:MAG: single-stranded DNA-binding protein [Candidatus Peregrinibacteria bacterium]